MIKKICTSLLSISLAIPILFSCSEDDTNTNSEHCSNYKNPVEINGTSNYRAGDATLEIDQILSNTQRRYDIAIPTLNGNCLIYSILNIRIKTVANREIEGTYPIVNLYNLPLNHSRINFKVEELITDEIETLNMDSGTIIITNLNDNLYEIDIKGYLRNGDKFDINTTTRLENL